MECRLALERYYPCNNEDIWIRILLMPKTGKYGKGVIGKYLLECNISLIYFSSTLFFMLIETAL